MKPETQTETTKPTLLDALSQLEENIKENKRTHGYTDYPTSIDFDGGKVFLTKCKNYIRVKSKYGTANYMLNKKRSPRLVTLDSVSIYSKMTHSLLKSVCKSNGLKVSGTKAELIARIDALLGEEE